MKKFIFITLVFGALSLFANDNMKSSEQKCDNGDAKICFELGKLYDSSYYKDHQKAAIFLKSIYFI